MYLHLPLEADGPRVDTRLYVDASPVGHLGYRFRDRPITPSRAHEDGTGTNVDRFAGRVAQHSSKLGGGGSERTVLEQTPPDDAAERLRDV